MAIPGRRVSIPMERVSRRCRSGRNACLVVGGLAQYIAAAPHRLYVVLAARSVGEFLAQLADEDVDDFELRLVHAAVEVVEEHLLGERRALAQAQELQHLVLLAGRCTRAPFT